MSKKFVQKNLMVAKVLKILINQTVTCSLPKLLNEFVENDIKLNMYINVQTDI